MDILYPMLVGLMFAISIYLLLARGLPRIVLGLVVLSNATHLLIFGTGRLSRGGAPIIPEHAYTPLEGSANALPQALILTAIVISFALFAYILILIQRTVHTVKTDIPDHMRLAEPDSDIDPNSQESPPQNPATASSSIDGVRS